MKILDWILNRKTKNEAKTGQKEREDITMRIFAWIVLILSLGAFSMTIMDLVNGIEYVGWDSLLFIIPFSLLIGSFGYLFQEKWFEKMNQKQKIILGIFIPIIISFFTLMIAIIMGFGNPFNWGSNFYVWLIFLIFICIFEYKLFADKKEKGK